METSREAEQTARQMQCMPFSRCSFERVGHKVGGNYVARRQQVEQGLIEKLEIPKEATGVSVAIDRVSVPMEEPVEKPADPKPLPAEIAEDPRVKQMLASEAHPNKEKEPKVMRKYRMAYCATVTLHNQKGKAIHTIRYGRMPDSTDYMRRIPRDLCESLARDVREILKKEKELLVSFLADGADDMWSLFDRHLNETKIGVKATDLVDFWHLCEYLGKAAVYMACGL